ncbi:hypothetical protein AALP_AA1G252000 [Arabis alpina]|uniref:Protein ENHANCED DISEASE RESISTANCE 2 C-terminal domain-containing protein n=1 Tax=Arabis alpina TaxID=50452 RepID=A0A087HQJ4_ARAAL|nr:hypothetical protein AALP_AA1G252000 [Arabis alpina]
MNQTEISKPAKTGSISVVPSWITETINGGAFPVVDLNTGSNGWVTPPGDVFPLRSVTYLKNKQKCLSGDYLLSPAGVDWLKSTAKLDNVLARPDNRVAHALRKAQSRGESLNSFIFALNFQIPTKEPNSLVFYFATENPIPSGSLLHRLINGEDSFRNQRFKLVGHVEKGPSVVKALVGKMVAWWTTPVPFGRGASRHPPAASRTPSGSYAIMAAAVRFTLGYTKSLKIDVGLVVEAQTEDELPEKLIGAVRLCQMEMPSAATVKNHNQIVNDDKMEDELPENLIGAVRVFQMELSSAFVVVDDDLKPCRMMGSAEGNQHDDEEDDKV